MTLQLIGLIIIIVATIVLFTGRNLKRGIVALGFMYLGSFLILFNNWPLELAAIKLVGGWMALAVLASTPLRDDNATEEQDAGAIFRAMVFTALFLAAWTAAPGTGNWIPGISFETALAGLLVALIGLIRTGLVRAPAQVVISLLATLSGFELLFSAIDSSALMTSLLAVMNLCIALTGAYLGATSEAEMLTEDA